MKRILIGTMMAVAFAAVGAAQTATPPPTPPQQQQTPPPPPPATPAPPQQTTARPADVTLVGCVVRGKEPNTYVFENAVDPAKKDDKARTFVLVVAPSMDLVPHVNHKIQLVGLAETKEVKPVPPATTVAEKDLPKFTIKTITHVADTCSEPGR